jgi:predicted DNA-binding transcriptional regulator AlpA
MNTHAQRGGEAMPSDELLDLKAVCAFFGGIDPSTAYRNIKRGLYPKPVKVGPNTSRWLRSECEAALRAMIDGRATQ